MSFVEGFYKFVIEINDTSRSLFETVRVRVAKHPDESDAYLLARVIAFAHSWRPGHAFGGGLFEPKDPTIQNVDSTGVLHAWIQIGNPDSKKLRRALKLPQEVDLSIYFLDNEQKHAFCHHLRGSTVNWAARIKFFQLNREFLDAASEPLSSSSHLQLTFADNDLFMVFNSAEFQTNVDEVDIWSEFQHSLNL